VSVNRDRDKTVVISWDDLSPFVTDIRERLELAGLGSRGVGELDDTLVHARPSLEELARHGGDPRFALYVLATARWRRLSPHEPRAPAWRKTLEVLEGDEALHRLLQHSEAPRARLRAALGDALDFLRTLGWQDEGLFDSRGTRKTSGGPRWAGRHLDRAAAVLKWHVHTATRGRWDRLAWLARMLQSFGLVAPSGTDPVPVERVKKRLQRLDTGYVAKFVIPDGRIFFHTLHTELGTGCGSACPAPSPTGNSHGRPAD
jgi:hypothetical protein